MHSGVGGLYSGGTRHGERFGLYCDTGKRTAVRFWIEFWNALQNSADLKRLQDGQVASRVWLGVAGLISKGFPIRFAMLDWGVVENCDGWSCILLIPVLPLQPPEFFNGPERICH